MGQHIRPRATSPDALVGTWADVSRGEWGAATASRNVERATRPADILVVEDEHIVALDILERLQAAGHRPEIVYDGASAVSRARAKHFDLILMDIKLGHDELDGIEAARQIHDIVDVPVIYVTAFADAATLERARITEPYGYILKPFQERELHAAIAMALHRHDTEEHRREEAVIKGLLAEVSARLASTLDYVDVLRCASQLLVPRYALGCMFFLDVPSDVGPSFVYAYPEGDAPRRWRPGAAGLVERVRSDRRPRLAIADRSQLAAQLGIDPVLVPDTTREVGTVLCVPIGAGERLLGVFTVLSHGPPDHGVPWLEDFGHRLGMALDNALLYREAREAVRMRDEVMAIVSHDLRNPLGAIILRAHALIEGGHDIPPERTGEAIRRDIAIEGLQQMGRFCLHRAIVSEKPSVA